MSFATGRRWALRARHFQEAADACVRTGDRGNWDLWRAALGRAEDAARQAPAEARPARRD